MKLTPTFTRNEKDCYFVIAENHFLRFHIHVVNEIWELAISPGVLPFSILLIPVACYWLLCLIGIVDIEMFDVDFDDGGDASAGLDGDGGLEMESDGDGSSEGAPSGGVMHSVMNFFNATDVPLMLVLSLLIVLLWMFAMLGNLSLPLLGPSLVALGALVLAILGTKLLTAPLRPIFRSLKEEETDPVIGKTALVRTSTISEKGGQITLEHRGTTNYLNARIASGTTEIARNSEVIIYGYDQDSGLYLVKEMPKI